jgi:hypothetical protein
VKIGQANNCDFFLVSNELGSDKIEDVEGLSLSESYVKNTDFNYFEVRKEGNVTLGETAYSYLLRAFAVYQVNINISLVTQIKDETKVSEDIITLSPHRIDMYSLSFDDKRREVTCDLIQDGFIEELDARWDDEMDITAEGLDPLPFVNLQLPPRKIESESKFVASEIAVNAKDDQGATARAIPLDFEYRSQPSFIGSISNTLANSANDTYAKLSTAGNCIITNAPEDFLYILNGTVEIEITGGAVSGYIHMDLVRFNNGLEQDFEEIVLRLDSNQQPILAGERLSYTFNDYELIVNEGDSIMIGTLSDTNFLSNTGFGYVVSENTSFTLFTDGTRPGTNTRALRIQDAFQRMIDIKLGDVVVDTSGLDNLVDIGEILIVNGSWIRNLPEVINEGEDDERRVQADLSMKDLYQALKIKKPLRYQPTSIGAKKELYIGLELETQDNEVGIKIEDLPCEPRRAVIGEAFYGRVTLGSETSGENYEEINNLLSVCGNASWETVNKLSKEEYSVLTDFRTGAEDFELQRFTQYEDDPNFDRAEDSQWFMIHAKLVGGSYVPVVWQDLFEQKPTGVFDADSNYNWAFTPLELLEGHGWKIKAGLDEIAGNSLKFDRSNCSSSLKTKKIGESIKGQDESVSHRDLDKATVRLMRISFDVVFKQSLIEKFLIRENLNKLVAYNYEGETVYGRLIEAELDRGGNIQLIEAKRT